MAGKISAEQDYLQAQQLLREAEIAAANAQQKLAAIGAGAGSSGGLNRFELRAPFDGVVVEKHLSVGEAVQDSTAVFTVSDLRSVWAEMKVAASDLPFVRVGEKPWCRPRPLNPGQAVPWPMWCPDRPGHTYRTGTHHAGQPGRHLAPACS